MLKNKKLLLILAAIVIIAVAVALILILPHGDSESSPSETSDVRDGNTESNESAADGEVYTDKSPITKNTDAKTFPFAISGTQIEVLSYTSYDGVFIEDGSDTAISGVSALIIRNSGKTAIELADISVECSGNTLQFTATNIPAGAMAVLQEKNRTPYSKGTLTDCRASMSEIDKLPMSEDSIAISKGDGNSLVVKNISDDTIPCARLFYKFYASEENAFVGGITYVAKITDLKPGAEKTITPTHYADGYSTVTMVRTYDTDK